MSVPPAGLSVNVEGVEDRLDAREVAVGVVVGRALAEVAQPADEVRRVRADELEDRRGLLQRRASSCANAGLATCSRRGALRSRSIEVVARARAADQLAQVADRRARVAHERAQLGEERREVASSPAWRPSTSMSRSSSVARRLTNVVFALRSVPGSSPSARASAAFSAPIAAAVVLALETRFARSPRRAASARDRLDGSTRKSRRTPAWSRIDLVDEPRGRRQRRVEVLRRLVGLLALARRTARRALDDLLQRLARRRVERVEELVEVDGRRRRVGRRASPPSSSLRPLFGPGVSAM